MKVARFSRVRPVLTVGELFGSTESGPSQQVPTATGSNGNPIIWGSNIANIFSNTSNQLLGPTVNFLSGAGIAFAATSNSLTISSTSGGGAAATSFGSNATRVSEVSSGGASTDASRADHIHDGIGTITASSSNTMQRGTWNIRPGSGIALTLSDTDGDGEFDTTTIVNTGSGGGGSSSSTTNDPVADAFGTPDTTFEFNTSSLTGLTAMGTADTEAAHTTIAGHLFLADDDSTQVGRYASVSAPATMIVKLTDYLAYENYQYVGCFVGVGTPGAFNWFGLLGGASPSLVGRTFTSPGDGGPGALTFTRVPTDPVGFTPWWFGIRVASTTDISFYVSRSGVVWQPVLLNRNPSLTVGSLGVSLGNYAGGSQPRAQGAYDYIRIWNSAKTFPAFE